jgi:hypothetical protein
VQGDEKFNDSPIALKGIYAIDMQANCVGLYWDEESDLKSHPIRRDESLFVELG